MERRSFQTSLGEIWLWGEAEAFDGDRPLVLAIRGATADSDDLEWLASSRKDVLFAHLPGYNSPPLVVNSIGVYIAAFDSVVETYLAGRRLTVLGASVGAIVAAGLRASEIQAKVLIEPFVSTEKLWPLVELIQASLGTANATYRDLAWSLLGVAEQRVAIRDYRNCFRADRRMIALVGSTPLLPRRPMWTLPSLATSEDIEFLKAIGAEVRKVTGGHDLAKTSPDAIISALVDAHEDHEDAAVGAGCR
jgi:hypothetical protein